MMCRSVCAMEIRQISPGGPLLSVQPLTPPRQSPHTPSHPLSTPPRLTESLHIRKVAVCPAGRLDTKTRFERLIDSFNEWLLLHPSPSGKKSCYTMLQTSTTGTSAAVRIQHPCSGEKMNAPLKLDQLLSEVRTESGDCSLSLASRFHQSKLLCWGMRGLVYNALRGREQTRASAAHYRLSMLSRALKTWQKELAKSRMCVETTEKVYGLKIVRMTFQAWRLHIYHITLARLCELYLYQKKLATLQSVFHIWVHSTSVHSGQRLIIARLTSLRDQHLCRKVLYGWTQLTRLSKLSQVVRDKHNTRLLLNYFTKWTEICRLSILQRHWSVWRLCVTQGQAQLDAARKQLNTHVLSHSLGVWRRCADMLQSARTHRNAQLTGMCFSKWRESSEWTHTEKALSFISRLHCILSSDPSVSYATLVHALITASKNLGLGDGDAVLESVQEGLFDSNHSQDHVEEDLSTGVQAPCDDHLCDCLKSQMASNLAEVKQRLTELSTSLNTQEDTRTHKLSDCSSGTLPTNKLSSHGRYVDDCHTQPPPVISMATRCIRHLRLYNCSKAFHRWRDYTLEWRLRLEHAQYMIRWLHLKRMFHHWRQKTAFCMIRQDPMSSNSVSQTEQEALTLRRVQLLSSVWSTWRQALNRERISKMAAEQSIQLLLTQVFTAWQSAV